MAAYNAAGFIAPAIQSVLCQTMAQVEIVVVDDCSSDHTCAIVSELAASDDRVRLERLTDNRGPGGARNRALELARGAWFAVLDADDLYAPDRLERLITAAGRKNADMIADNPVVFSDEGGDPPSLFLPGPPESGWLGLEAYLRGTMMFATGGADYGYLKPIFRTESLRAGGFSYNPALRIAEDDDLIVRLLLAGRRYWLEPIPAYGYRKHAGSISHRLSTANASAMTEHGAAVAAIQPSGVIADLLVQRYQAFFRAAEFSRLIDALKARDPITAIGLCARSPGIIPMLRMPISAALARLPGAELLKRPPRRDPLAELALRSLFSTQDHQL
jgi:succinoglycan biosynthesis protein ExoO